MALVRGSRRRVCLSLLRRRVEGETYGRRTTGNITLTKVFLLLPRPMVVRIESHPFIIECGSVAAPVIVCLDGGRLRAQAVGACWKVSIGESVIFLAGGDEVKVSSHARHYRHTKEQVVSFECLGKVISMTRYCCARNRNIK